MWASIRKQTKPVKQACNCGQWKEVTAVKMERVMVQLPKGIKAKLDRLRLQGTSISGFIRSIVERELNHAPSGQKGLRLMATTRPRNRPACELRTNMVGGTETPGWSARRT